MLKMELGQVVDYITEYNNMHSKSDESGDAPRKRKATQADIDSFYGA